MNAETNLLNNLHYDPDTGFFTWTKSRGNRKAGSRAGHVNGDGYVRIAIKLHYYSAHRLAWLATHGYWPPGDIDHINGVRDDNRIINLRSATRAQNAQNRFKSTRSGLGLKGTGYDVASGRWWAGIKKGWKRLHLGCFDTAEAAHATYCAAAQKAFGKFFNPGEPK